MAKIKGLTIELSADYSGVKKGLTEINKDSRLLQNELKAVDKALQLDPGNSELVAKKQKLLKEQIELTNQKLKDQKTAFDLAKKGGDGSKEAERLQRRLATQIQQTNTELKKQELEMQTLSKSGLRNLNIQTGELRDKIKHLTGSMALIGAGALAGVGTTAVKEFATLEQGLLKVSTLFGGVSVNSENLETRIKGLSRVSGIAAGELTEGLYQALSAGVPVTEEMGVAMDYLDTAIKLAKGGFTDITTAIDATTTIINAYGLEVSEVKRISDLLITTQNKGKIEVGELGAYLAQVIPTAAGLGVSFEQVGAALASMTAQGTGASQATTALNQLFVSLGQQGNKTSDLFKSLTGQTFIQFIEEGKTVGDAMKVLASSIDGTDKSLIDLFGSVESGKSALQIAAQDGEIFNDSLNAMSDSAGATQKAFETMDASAMEQMKIAFNDLKISLAEIGEKVWPLVKPVFEWITSNSNMVAVGIGAITAAVFALAGAWLALTIASLPISGTLLLIVAAVGAVVASVFVYWNDISAFFSTVGAFFQNLGAKIGEWWNGVVMKFTEIKDKIVGKFVAIKDAIVNKFIEIKNAILTFLTPVLEPIKKVIDETIGQITYTFNNIKETAALVFGKIGEEIMKVFTWLNDNLFTPMKEKFTTLMTALQNLFTGIGTGIQTIITNITTWLDVNLFTPVREKFTALMEALKNLFMSVINVILGVIKFFVENAWNNIKGLVDLVIGRFLTIKDTIFGVFNGVLDFIKNVFTGNWSGAWESLKNIVNIAWEGLKSILWSPFQWILDKLEWFKDKIKGAFSWITGGNKEQSLQITQSQNTSRQLATNFGNGLLNIGRNFNYQTPAALTSGLTNSVNNINNNNSRNGDVIFNINGGDKSPRQLAREIRKEMAKL